MKPTLRIHRHSPTAALRTALLAPLALAAALLPASATAQQRTDSAEIAELRRRIDAITRELEAVRLGREVVEADTTVMGFGPAAGKVYQVTQGVSIGGYGEILYENFAEETEGDAAANRPDRFDALRGIIYVGYKFNDRILFNSEIEIEHASTDKPGAYASLEFAYVDYRLTDEVGVRGGLLLAPMGLLNELHEPPVWLGTIRPLTENRIIPTTWRENGIGLFGDYGDFAWRAYLMNSFDGAAFGAGGLRGGRQKGSNALAEDMALVGRVDYRGVPGLMVGASAFHGETGQNRTLPSGEEVDGATTIWEAHADYKRSGFDLRALYAAANVDDAAQLNLLRNVTTGAGGVGSEMHGWYVQGGYDVLWLTGSEQQLIPYVRYEQIDTQAEVPTGFARGPANEATALSIGAAWKPLVQVIVKADWQKHSNEADTGINQFNVVLGYLF